MGFRAAVLPSVLLSCALALFAQNNAGPARQPTDGAAAAPTAGEGFPIRSISVRGSGLYTWEDLAALTDLKVGQPLDDAALRNAQRQLSDSGLFSMVGFEYRPSADNQGYALIFEVSDFAQKYPVRFDRLGKPDAELLAYLEKSVPLFRNPIPYSERLIDQVKRALESEVGPVASRVATDGGDELFLLIHPTGAPPVIRQVRILGAEAVDASEIQFAMNSVAVGVEYRESLFAEMLRLNALPLYETRGKLRARFTGIETRTAGDAEGLVVDVTVEEGPSYNFGEVAITGAEGDAPEDELKSAANLKAGEVANFQEVAAAQARLHVLLRRNGFLDVNSQVERSVDDEKRTVGIGIRLDPGPQYVFGRLRIEGLDLIGEAEIKRIWGMNAGQPFNPEYPDFFLNRVKEEGLFDDLKETKAAIQPNPRTRTADVTLIFN
jgi:outer membrane protein insertion porin family